jgi:hypothetical protein
LFLAEKQVTNPGLGKYVLTNNSFDYLDKQKKKVVKKGSEFVDLLNSQCGLLP